MNAGFEEVVIYNAPADFISTSSTAGEVKGYLINWDQFDDKASFGLGSVSEGKVYFGKDDVLVYDKNGTVYYAKGYEDGEELYYNATVYVHQ